MELGERGGQVADYGEPSSSRGSIGQGTERFFHRNLMEGDMDFTENIFVCAVLVTALVGGVIIVHVIGLGILHLMDRRWAKKPGRWI